MAMFTLKENLCCVFATHLLMHHSYCWNSTLCCKSIFWHYAKHISVTTCLCDAKNKHKNHFMSHKCVLCVDMSLKSLCQTDGNIMLIVFKKNTLLVPGVFRNETIVKDIICFSSHS